MRKLLSLLVLLVPVFGFSDDRSDRMQVVNIYAKDLKSRDPATRAEAAEKLGEFEAPEGVPLLITALSDKDARVRQAAASGLWSSSDVAQPAIPALRVALNDSEPAVVIRAAGALINMDVEPAEIAEPLRLVLQKGDVVDRFLAARALIGVEPGDKVVGPIVDYMRANAPGTDRFENGTKALLRLGKTKDQKIVAPLMTQLRESPQLAEPILRTLGEVEPRPDGWIETLVGQLGSRDAKVRDAAVDLLGKQNKTAADVKAWAGAVARLATDPDKSVRYEVVSALDDARGLAYEGLPGVLQMLTSEKEADIREDAAEAVGEIADAEFPISADIKKTMAEQALPVLTKAIKSDPLPKVRQEAVRSVNKLQLPLETVIPLLANIAVENKANDVGEVALQVLRNRGRESVLAADIVRPLMNDPNETVRTQAKAIAESGENSYSSRKPIESTVAKDPAAREKAFEFLRENKLDFAEDAFYKAFSDGDIERVTAFLDAGMSPNLRFASSSRRPTLYVALEGDACHPAVRPTAKETKDIIKLLLARGADPKIADENNNTPLMAAAEKCDAEVVKMLLKAGADMNVKNGSDLTAFEFGLYNGNDGAAVLTDAGFRLSDEKVKIYREGYKDRPKSQVLLKKAVKGSAPAKAATKK